MGFQRSKIADFWREVRVGEPYRAGLTPCWVYCGSDAYQGYKAFRCVLAHRAAAVIYTGEIPGRVKQICNNKHCVRFDHLKISPRPEYKPRFSPLTGRILERKDYRDPEFVQRVLDARPSSGKYSTLALAEKVGTNHENAKKALREAALYDLLADLKYLIESNQVVQREPTATSVTVGSR